MHCFSSVIAKGLMSSHESKPMKIVGKMTAKDVF